MKGALIILAVTVATGFILYVVQKIFPRKSDDITTDNGTDSRPEGCCGQHIVCEKDSLLAAVSTEIEYYEDEELDNFRGIGADDYTDEQIEQFRDVLYTLRPDEIGGWARSIQLRGINLPAAVKDELIMLAAEARTQQ